MIRELAYGERAGDAAGGGGRGPPSPSRPARAGPRARARWMAPGGGGADGGVVSRSGAVAADRGEGVDGLAADPVFVRHDQLRLDGARASAAVARELAGHR